MEKQEKNLLKKGRAYLMEELGLDNNSLVGTEEYQNLKAEFEEKQNKIIEKLKEIKAGTKEYVEIANEYVKLQDIYANKITEIANEIENRNFEQLGGKAENIIADAKKRAENMIQALYRSQNDLSYAKQQEELENTGEDEEPFLAGLNEFIPQKVSIDMALACIHADLVRHYEELENDEASIKEINDFITDLVANSDLIDYKRKDLDSFKELDKNAKQKELNLQLFSSDEEIMSFEDYSIVKHTPISQLKRNIMLTDNVMTELFRDPNIYVIANNGNTWIVDYRSNNEVKDGIEPINTFFTLKYDGTNIKLSNNIDGYDESIFNSIITAMLDARDKHIPNWDTPILTAEELQQIATGRTGKKIKLTSKQEKKINDSLYKMLHTDIIIDYSQEYDRRNFIINGEEDSIDSLTDQGLMLNWQKREVKTRNGRRKSAYQFLGMPILAQYCLSKNRVLSTNPKLLYVSEELSSKENSLEFTQYIAKRIQSIKDGRYFETKILYNTLYKEAGVLKPSKKLKREDYKNDNAYKQAIKDAKRRDREIVDKILTAEKENGFIKNFKKIKKGYEYVGVELIFDSKETYDIKANKIKYIKGKNKIK